MPCGWGAAKKQIAVLFTFPKIIFCILNRKVRRRIFSAGNDNVKSPTYINRIVVKY